MNWFKTSSLSDADKENIVNWDYKLLEEKHISGYDLFLVEKFVNNTKIYEIGVQKEGETSTTEEGQSKKVAPTRSQTYDNIL
jgi:hypothetical protein